MMVLIKKSMNINYLEAMVITYHSANMQDLQFLVQFIQVLIFSISHCFIFVEVDHIFVIADQEQLQWINWIFHYM